MVVVKIADGIGNQIFRYVCGYAVAKKKNEELVLDIADYNTDTYRTYELDKFRLHEHRLSKFPNRTILGKVLRRLIRSIFYHVIYEQNEDLFGEYKKSIYLDGYYIDLKYYDMYKEEIREQLKPGYNMSEATQNAIDYCKNHKTCGIHMRLGDLQYDSLEYFNKAIQYIIDRIPDIEFVLFSNDIKLAQNILSKLQVRFKIVDELGSFSDVDSFFLLQSCQHQILSQGTFGIWAGILNSNPDKIVCIPHEVVNAPSFPDDWIRL